MSPALHKEHCKSEEARDNDSQKSHQQFTFATGIGICNCFSREKDKITNTLCWHLIPWVKETERLQEGSSV